MNYSTVRVCVSVGELYERIGAFRSTHSDSNLFFFFFFCLMKHLPQRRLEFNLSRVVIWPYYLRTFDLVERRSSCYLLIFLLCIILWFATMLCLFFFVLGRKKKKENISRNVLYWKINTMRIITKVFLFFLWTVIFNNRNHLSYTAVYAFKSHRYTLMTCASVCQTSPVNHGISI